MSAESLKTRVRYLHGALFSFHRAKLCFKEELMVIWWKLAQTHRQFIDNHYVKCIQLPFGRPQGRGFHTWPHIGITWEALTFWYQVPPPEFWISWSGMQSGIWHFWKLSKWLKVSPSLKIIALKESKRGSWTQENCKLVRNVNMRSQLKPIESELWWWALGEA